MTFATGTVRTILTALVITGPACDRTPPREQDRMLSDTTATPAESVTRAAASTRSIGTRDSVLDAYLNGLPKAGPGAQDVDDSEEARSWESFFDDAPLAEQKATDEQARAQAARVKLQDDVELSQHEADEALKARDRAHKELDVASEELAKGREVPAGLAFDIDEAVATEEKRLEEYQAANKRAEAALSAAAEDQGNLAASLQREELAQVLLQRAAARVEPLDLSLMLNRELKVNGIVVKVEYNRNANRNVGLARCENGKPVIYLALRPSARLTPEALLFFREHEFGHHLRGHLACAGGRTARKGQRGEELEADCAAAETLTSFPRGEAVVFAVYGNLSGLGIPQDATHPSSRDRADHLFKCP